MNTRIRYKKQSEANVYESVRSFMTKDGVVLKALYSPVDSTLSLVDSTGTTVVSESYASVHAAKLTLKKKLKELGIVFNDEVRRKKEA